MSKLPLRFRVLKEISLEKKGHHIPSLMAVLEKDYGSERQFHVPAFLDHVLSLKENGLINEKSVELDGNGELLVTYEINDLGRDTLKKYLPKQHR